jgi:hypothetical protein
MFPSIVSLRVSDKGMTNDMARTRIALYLICMDDDTYIHLDRCVFFFLVFFFYTSVNFGIFFLITLADFDNSRHLILFVSSYLNEVFK